MVQIEHGLLAHHIQQLHRQLDEHEERQDEHDEEHEVHELHPHNE